MRTALATIAIMVVYLGGGFMQDGAVITSLVITGIATTLLGVLFAMGHKP